MSEPYGTPKLGDLKVPLLITDLAPFPALKTYLKECTTPILAPGAVVNALVEGCKKPGSTEYTCLDLLNGVLTGTANRVKFLENQKKDLEAKYLALQNEKDTLEKRLQVTDELKTALEAQLQLQQEGIDATTKNDNDGTKATDKTTDGKKADPNYELLAALIEKIDSSGSGATLPHVPPFDGSEADTAKRTQAFRTFKTLIITRWNARPREFRNEHIKICYIASLLRGAAQDGVAAGMERVNANPEDPSLWPWKTGLELLDHLSLRFATLDLVADAENRLRGLTQSGKFARFSDFITEYSNLTDMAKWDNTARVRGLKEKLNAKMRNMLNCQYVTPKSDDYQGWVDMAQKMASNIEGEEYIRKINGEAANLGGSGSNNNGKPNRGNNGGAGNAEAGDPMDLDTMRLAVNKLDPAERSRRMAEGRCLHCGRKGHLMRDCRSRARTNGREGQGGGRGDNSQGQQRGGGQSQPQGGTPAQFPGYGGYPQTTPTPFGLPQQPYGQFNQPYGGFPTAPPRRGGYQGGPQLRYVNVPNPGFAMEIPTESDSYSQSGYGQATGSGTGTPYTGWNMPQDNNHSENE